MKSKTLFLVFFASTAFVFGQNTEKIPSKWSVYWHPGSNWDFERNQYTGLDDLAPYVQKSKLKPEDYNPQYNDNYRNSGISNYFSILNFGLQYDIGKWFAKSDKTSFSIRSGVNYLGNIISARTSTDFEQVFLDSTYNMEYNVMMQRDSFYSESYYASKSSKTIRWQNEFVVRRQLSKRFKLIYGIGAGVTFKSDITFLMSESKAQNIYQTTSNGNELVKYQYDPYYSQNPPAINAELIGVENGTNEQQTWGLPGEIGGFAYIPLSLEFAMGKKNNVLARMNIYFEGQFGMRWEADNFGDNKTIFLLNHGFGFRYVI